MKKKNLNQKLTLNKQTIVNLGDDANSVIGGAKITRTNNCGSLVFTDCNCTWWGAGCGSFNDATQCYCTNIPNTN